MRQAPAKDAAKSVPKNFPQGKSGRGKWTWQVLCDKTNKRRQQTTPILLSGVPQGCLRPHTWASWSVAAFPRDSSFCTRSKSAPRKTEVALAGFPWKTFNRWWVGATERENKEGSLCAWWLWASLCGRLDCWWGWCRWPTTASTRKGVLFVECFEDGRQLWTCQDAVGAVCSDCPANQRRSSLDSSRKCDKFRILSRGTPS